MSVRICVLVCLVACSGPAQEVGDDDGPMADAGGSGSGSGSGSGAGSGSGSADPTFTWPTCGGTAFDQSQLHYGNAIAVAADGTVFHAMFDGGESYVSRYRPNQPAEPTWAHVGTGGVGTTWIAVDPSGTPYALVGDSNTIGIVKIVNGTVTGVGPHVASTSGPTSLAFSPDGLLFEGSFTGIQKVDLATGAATPISSPVMLRELYFTGARTARGVSYDHGLVELALDAAAAHATFTTLFPFDTIALQFTGLDQQGRTYALVHEMSKDELVRFDPTFATRETLYSYPSVSIALGKLAFGRGALRCDVLVTGFSIAHVTTGETPAVP